jgi:hypothetical protein
MIVPIGSARVEVRTLDMPRVWQGEHGRPWLLHGLWSRPSSCPEVPERPHRPRRRLTWLFGGSALMSATVFLVWGILSEQDGLLVLAAVGFGAGTLEYVLQRPMPNAESRAYLRWRKERKGR